MIDELLAERPLTDEHIDQARYRRILRFFASVIASIIWWDLAVGRVPIARNRALSTRPQRLRQLSRDFRALAVEMGGVLIKLGQFLSTRVDVLPLEVTEELQGLQDEVPPADSRAVFALLRGELGNLSERFCDIDEEPLAAASLGQVYRARLRLDGGPGPKVVIKVQRPGIEDTVRTDLAALRVVSRWVMRYRPIGRRANVPALMEEFAHTLWQELDYRAEADHADRFAQIHSDDARVYIPAVYRQHSTGRVVVLEDVESIRIDDVSALRQAGVDPKSVADVLLEAYFKQIFVAEFFHADPHPGNLFVRPLPANPTAPDAPRPFQVVFIDFGMAVTVPAAVGESLRKLVIGVTQRNAVELVGAFRDLGFLLPGADFDRIVEAAETILDRVWGRNLLQLARPDPREVEELGREFRDLLYAFPFQVPQDFIYLGRALGMISGLVSTLDPDINPWRQIERYGQTLIRNRNLQPLRDGNFESLLELLRPYFDLPFRLQRLFEDAEKGRLKVQLRADRETLRHQERLEKRVGQLGWSILGAASILSATLIYLNRRRDR
jgi:predicted unusual protein kinase regulating ubiquinone biosynthesis (AarF/ABC1/UbiB family)